jgi:hypothetical protein
MELDSSGAFLEALAHSRKAVARSQRCGAAPVVAGVKLDTVVTTFDRDP